jgi:hypothetical protein
MNDETCAPEGKVDYFQSDHLRLDGMRLWGTSFGRQCGEMGTWNRLMTLAEY